MKRGESSMKTSRSIVDKVKDRILDLAEVGFDKGWFEGYISALADYEIISEDQFDELLYWLIYVGED